MIGSDDLEQHIGAGLAIVTQSIVTQWHADAITVAGADLRGLLRDLGHPVTR